MFELIQSISIDAEAGKATGKAFVPANHPSLADHFPGMPILPGSFLIELASQIAGPLSEEVIKLHHGLARWAIPGMIRNLKFLDSSSLPSHLSISATVLRHEASNVLLNVSVEENTRAILRGELVMMMIDTCGLGGGNHGKKQAIGEVESCFMTIPPPTPHLLSPTDAFFVAYQQGSGTLMQLGFELELQGTLKREDLESLLLHLVARWPQLGQKLRQRVLGLAWDGAYRIEEMLRVESDETCLTEWRNSALNPFCEPPFQVLWIARDETHRLAARAHHAVMDGEAMLTVYLEMMKVLALLKGEASLPIPVSVPPRKLSGPIESLALLCSPKTWRQLRGMSKETKAGVSATLSLRSFKPGPTATCERRLDGESFKRLSDLAGIHRTQPLWLCVAAWIRALHAWNQASSKGANPIISLEFPVSLRRKNASRELLGNMVSPLILSGDATQSVGPLANALKQQFIAAIRQRQHLALPSLIRPLRFLPWTLFRRLVMTPLATGTATSHFTWHEDENDCFSKISQWSRGKLQMINRRIYTPVCLHMGAALVVVCANNSLLFSISYRLNALTTDDANKLADLLQSELMLSLAELINQDAN